MGGDKARAMFTNDGHAGQAWHSYHGHAGHGHHGRLEEVEWKRPDYLRHICVFTGNRRMQNMAPGALMLYPGNSEKPSVWPAMNFP